MNDNRRSTHEGCPACASPSYRSHFSRSNVESRNCSECDLTYRYPLLAGEAEDVGGAASSITDPGYHANIKKNYASQSELAKPKAAKMLAYWSQILGFTPKSILEIGCGTGQYFQAWSKLGVAWTGAETSPKMIDFCQSKGMPVSHLDEVQVPEKGYDVVFLSQVLEHILQPNEFLDQIKPSLNDRGILHLDVPNQDSIAALTRKISPFHEDYGFVQPPHHQIAYSPKALSTLLEKKGFQVIECSAFPNNDPTFGQLITAQRFYQRILFGLSSVTGKGSLLVGVAQKMQS